jgi:acetylornithine deacetylase
MKPLGPPSDRIRDAVVARRSWGLLRLRELMQIESVAPNEGPCQEALAAILRMEGLPVSLIPLDRGDLRNAEGFIDAGLPLSDRPNLVVSIGGESSGGRSLILNSHIDTVPPQIGEGQRPDAPPAEVPDGRVCGRGAVDAKGQIIAAIMAVLALRDLGYEPGGSLTIQSVVGEEPTGNGTLALCAQGWAADAAVVLEPTENHVAYAHRGIIGLRYLVRAQGGHASVTGSEANAILAASRVVPLLDRALSGWSDPSDAEYGPPSLNVGRIDGGESIFSVPAWCTIECGVRYAPATYEAVMAHMRDRLRQTDEYGAMPVDLDDVTVFCHFDAAKIPSDSPVARGLLSSVRKVMPDRRLVVFPAGCDARHFVNRNRIPTVIFGPGELATAHAADESLDVDQWLAAVQALALFIAQWCR